MPYRNIDFTPGQYYHVYNRGAGGEEIFFNPGNYEYCSRLVKKYSLKYGMSKIAYCFMPNHYHILIRQDTEISISKFINVIFNTYVHAVNRQQRRQGTLFEGRFNHVLVDKEQYLIQLCRYIHLNPVKAGIVTTPEEWIYSNYLEWIGERGGEIIDKEFVSEWFDCTEDYRNFVMDFLEAEKSNRTIRRYLWD